ncbi:MAG: hypothetical protein NT150_11975 [Bacteroidetes bacterium]|nr:hypothetical protein [Bacteroidota bacterium]
MQIRNLYITILFLSLTSLVSAQYRTSIGGIAGKQGVGLSFKQFIQPEQNIEINFLYRRPGGGQLVALFQLHKEINNSTLHTRNLSWSFGGGIHAGYWKMHELGYKNGDNKSIGIDGVVGFEYNFGFIPITVGAQVRPYWEYRTYAYDNVPPGYLDASFLLRFIIAD